MQADYPAAFEREMGCTVQDLRGWLPGASGSHALHITDDGAEVSIDGGALHLSWQQLPPRRIALITLPRLAVRFRFEGIGEDARTAFMRHFDLYTQRGGG